MNFKTRAVTSILCFVAILCWGAQSADGQLYTEGPGTNPPFEEIRNSISNGYSGTDINVNNSLVEGGLYGQFGIQPDLKIHTLASSVIGQNAHRNWSRWYQTDGATEVFRLFPGEENVRNSRPLAARIEAFDTNTRWNVSDGEWNTWVGRYTIIKPIKAAIFQVKDVDDEAWSLQLSMRADGEISAQHRRPLPGQAKRVTLIENAIGQSFDIRIRDNGRDYELYLNDQVEPIMAGTYVRNSEPGDNSLTGFRWGIYVGASEVETEGLIFISHATVNPDIDFPSEPPAEPATYGSLIAGWDTWANGSNPDASVAAPGFIGSAATTSQGAAWNVSDGRGASADGSWGTFDGSPTPSTAGGNGVTNENLELSNAASGGTLTFTLTNNGTTDIDLDGFHFDAYAFRPKAARAYELSIVSGDLTNGLVYASADDEITSVGGAWSNDAHDDISHSLSGLADHTLEAGGTVSFQLSFSSGDGDGSGGHDLWVDNVAITGAAALVSQASDGSLRFNKSTGAVDGSGMAFIVDSGGLDIGQTGTAPYDRAAVMVFQLPDLGTIESPFQSASFRAYLTETVTSGNIGGDLYGIGRRTSPEILNSDYYGLTNIPDPDAVLLEDDFLVEGMSVEAHASTSEMGSSNLTDFLNQQYAGGAGIGEYVFLRINVDSETSQRWTIASGNAVETTQKPQITYQAMSGPSAQPGDFDADGDVDMVDLDRYNGNIGATATGELEALDLDGDGIVGANDFASHYKTLVETSNGQAGTFAGDLNLDGTVNVLGDAFALIANLGGSANSWGQGDFNGDGTANVLGDAFALIANLGQTNE